MSDVSDFIELGRQLERQDYKIAVLQEQMHNILSVLNAQKETVPDGKTAR